MSSNEIDLNLKVGLVTGASSKIGTAIAILLSKLGFQLIITDSDQKLLSKIAKKCEQSAKYANKWHSVDGKWIKVQRTVSFAVDYQSDGECQRLIDSVNKNFGKIDLFVNNCCNERKCNLNNSNLMEIYDEMIALELRSLVLLTHLTVPFLEITNGNIIFIFNSSAVKPEKSFLINCMTNSSAQIFTKCLALELGPKKVRVNSITHSKLFDQNIDGIEVNQQLINQLIERLEKNNNLSRLLCSEDVANAVNYLASNEADFVNGINLMIDGGDTL